MAAAEYSVCLNAEVSESKLLRIDDFMRCR